MSPDRLRRRASQGATRRRFLAPHTRRDPLLARTTPHSTVRPVISSVLTENELEEGGETMTKDSDHDHEAEQEKAIQKEAGMKIDPETAEVDWGFGVFGDLRGEYNIGRV